MPQSSDHMNTGVGVVKGKPAKRQGSSFKRPSESMSKETGQDKRDEVAMNWKASKVNSRK